MANRVVMRICGEELTFVAEESTDYMQRVGAFVGEQMQDILNSSKVSRSNAAVLTAVNIADELFKVREADEQLRAQIKGYLDETSAAKAEISELKREVLRLQKVQKKLEKLESGEKPKRGRGKAKAAEAVETEPAEAPAEAPEEAAPAEA